VDGKTKEIVKKEAFVRQQMKTHLFGVAEIYEGYLRLGSVTNGKGEPLRFRAVGVAPELNGRVKFHASLQELDEIGVVACMLSCEATELPQIVWVSARVEGGRISGLGKTTLAGSEVMGVLGGVFQKVVIFIDPAVAPVNAGRKRRRAKEKASGPGQQGQHSNGDPANPAVVADSQSTGDPSDLPKDKIPPLHDRVEVLSPQTKEAFPCTTATIPILDDREEEKVDKAAGRKKKKDSVKAHSHAGGVNEGGNGVHSREDDGALVASVAGETPGPLDADPNLLLRGTDGRDIGDNEVLF
jgi:hypothetical protein